MGLIKGVRYCKVISISDDTDRDLIKVRISPEDDGLSDDSKIPYAFPLLPKMFHVKPKIGEGVFVFLAEADNAMSQRYYIGPVISQDDKIYKDNYLYATSFMKGTPFKPDISPTAKPEMNGVLPNDNDVDIRGRKNADIQITDDDVRIKSGVKVVSEINNYEMHFNNEDPAYMKIKYHPNGLYDNKDNYEGEQIKSTVTLVGDKINLIKNNSKEKQFVTTDTNDLITDSELKTIITEAYKLPFGEKLVEILSILIDAFIRHTHPFPMLPPCNSDGIPELKTLKTEYLDNEKILSDTVRIN